MKSLHCYSASQKIGNINLKQKLAFISQTKIFSEKYMQKYG